MLYTCTCTQTIDFSMTVSRQSKYDWSFCGSLGLSSNGAAAYQIRGEKGLTMIFIKLHYIVVCISLEKFPNLQITLHLHVHVFAKKGLF